MSGSGPSACTVPQQGRTPKCCQVVHEAPPSGLHEALPSAGQPGGHGESGKEAGRADHFRQATYWKGNLHPARAPAVWSHLASLTPADPSGPQRTSAPFTAGLLFKRRAGLSRGHQRRDRCWRGLRGGVQGPPGWALQGGDSPNPPERGVSSDQGKPWEL